MSSWHLSSTGPGRSGKTEVRAGTWRDLKINAREASKAGDKEGHKLHLGDTLTVHHIISLVITPEGGDVQPILQKTKLKLPGECFQRGSPKSICPFSFSSASVLH